ncbi:hypothetical protein FRC12_024647 [Ceratobasidium sp. 428]|nr:hypothetical protein FRC12_024647 [Ceratobasidium sp. 428]
MPKVSYELSLNNTLQELADRLQDFTQLNNGTISYNTSNPSTIPGSGQFKHCFLGKITLDHPPWPNTTECSLQVALKQPFTFYPTRSNGTVRFPPEIEPNNIVTEAMVLQWGSSLLGVVHSFIEEFKQVLPENDECPLIPSLRFVHFGIAKCLVPGQKTAQSLQGALLVEEEILRAHGFVQFLGNASAIPFEFPPGSVSENVVLFCAFAQPVQWVTTEGQGYRADWQDASPKMKRANLARLVH